MNNDKYDVVFWAYNSMVVDRCMPLMVRLNEKGYKTLLFYQDYDLSDSLAPAQELLLKRYKLSFVTYSDFFKKDSFLRLLAWGIKNFRNSYFGNKLRGLRTKILAKKVDENFVRKIISRFNPKLNIYDTINSLKYSDYPIGSYYIKCVSDEYNIPGIAIPHGIRTHYKKINATGKFVDFKKVVIASEKERECMEEICTENVEGVVTIGDPRYDSSWKSELRKIFKGNVGRLDAALGTRKVLYLLPSMEQFGMDDVVYKALGRIAHMAASLGNIKLFIRPHPRHRHKDKISRVIRENGLTAFEVIGNDPLIAYVDEVDYVISPVTSALFDFIPEMDEKVLIYYEFLNGDDFINIFRGHINFFEDIDSLKDYLKGGCKRSIVNKEEMERYCDKLAANGEGLDTIIERYVDLIQDELKNGDM